MKSKSLFFVASLLLVLFTGCSKDETDTGIITGPEVMDTVDGVGDVYLQFSEASSSQFTKAEALPVSGGLQVRFEYGTIFFVNSTTREIEKSFTIGSNAEYTVLQLTEGATFTNIPNTANVVYVIANHEIAASTAAGADMATILAETTDLSKQSDDNYGVTNVSLVGMGQLTDSSKPGVSREATFGVDPIVGRIELAKVSSKVTTPAADGDRAVTSFKLAGVFINNFYYEAPVYGSLSDATEQPYQFGKIAANYDEAPDGGYLSSWKNYIFDLYSAFSATNSTDAIASVDGSVTPTTASTVWAYNLFPTPGNLPRIVLHLKDVKYTENNSGTISSETDFPNSEHGDGTAYLTVQKYTSSEGNIETIAAGNIYKISNLEFEYDDLTENPEGKVDPDDEDKDKFNVWVQIELINWQAIEVEGGF
ncbi:MAG: hypothetical protein LIP06_11875 [Tannerellaceae bacterium]|nr:hypothetical protein [Tannerellaceae bacterium]